MLKWSFCSVQALTRIRSARLRASGRLTLIYISYATRYLRAGPGPRRAMQRPPRCTHHKPGHPSLTASHRSVCFENQRRGSEANLTFLRLSCIVNAAEFDGLFNPRSSAASPLLCSGISHTALMSHYFPHRSASDKRLRQAVKNRSKPPGWEEEEEEKGADGRLNHPPPPLRLTGFRKCHPLFVSRG